MEPIVGNEKQEEIIQKLGALANQRFPQIGLYPFKGLFRVSIGEALKSSTYKNLKDLWKQVPRARSEFFDQVLKESKPLLEEQGLSVEDVEDLVRGVRDESDAKEAE